MKLIIGGAYQGKLDYAKKEFGFSDDDIFTCSENETIDFSRPCIHEFQEFTLYLVKSGISPVEFLKSAKDKWENSIIICREIFSGVVPIDAALRAWREETGRAVTYLSQNAESVTRLFCGIAQRIK